MIRENLMMKLHEKNLKKLWILNALLLALSVVITINLLATGGRAPAKPSESAPQQTQAADSQG